jgi:perosamine synthetase
MSSRIPLSIPDLRGRETEFLARCVRENWVSSAGPDVGEFERRIAERANRRHAVATVNGTAALHLALLASGVKPGDRVIVPDWTFAATANAVAHAGATPVFVDVRDEDWALDPALLSEALDRFAPVRAVIAVDPLGHSADIDALEEICVARGVPLIEDAAGAIGARYHDRPCGKGGLAATFSFNGNKTMTAGGGGMVVTDDSEFARLVRHLSTQARLGGDYVHDAVGYNYRMTNLNAALGLAQLERLDEMVAARRAIAARYDAAFAKMTAVSPMPRPAHSDSTGWLYSIQLESERAARDLVRRLGEAEIEARVFWNALSKQAPWVDSPRRLCGISEGLSGTVVSLPSSSSLTETEQERVVAVIRDWVEERWKKLLDN